MPRPTLPWVVKLSAKFLLMATSPASAQQVVEIDFDTGRTIIDDEWRALSSHLVAADWERNILYVHDAEEPEGIMAFSLETGQWIRTVPTPRGDGPYEFSQGRTGVAIAPGGGLYVSGFLRVVEFNPLGMPFDSWRPEVPVARRVCNFGGAPAVPTQGGVVWRGPDGTSEAIGPVRARGRNIDGETLDEVNVVLYALRSARIVCRDDRAYVAMSFEENSPDSLFVYRRNGEKGRLAVPVEDARGRRECTLGEERDIYGRVVRPERPCPHWSRGAQLSLDDRGNVVLLGLDSGTHGTIINPESGCYALIRGTTAHPHTPVGIHGDSVLVFRHRIHRRTEDGRTIISIDDDATGVSLHPVRRVSGEPCHGMLQEQSHPTSKPRRIEP